MKGKLTVTHGEGFVGKINDEQICVFHDDIGVFFFLLKSPEPIRILDLTECSAVQFDYSQERVNCFW